MIKKITKEINAYQKFLKAFANSSPLESQLKNVINALENWLDFLTEKIKEPNTKNIELLQKEGILNNFNWFTPYSQNSKSRISNLYPRPGVDGGALRSHRLRPGVRSHRLFNLNKSLNT